VSTVLRYSDEYLGTVPRTALITTDEYICDESVLSTVMSTVMRTVRSTVISTVMSAVASTVMYYGSTVISTQ
jgi:hypothetical protein